MLSESKLAYIGSASVVENRLGLSVPKDLQDLVRAAPDVAMRELLQDYVVNKHFRRDVYIKGPVQLSPQERRERLGNITFALTNMQSEVPDKMRVPAGEATLNRAMVDAVLQRLAEGPARADDLIAASEAAGARPVDVFRLLEILVHHSLVYPARPAHIPADRAQSKRLNSAILSLTSSGNVHQYLASPVLGSALPSGYVDRLLAPLLSSADEEDEEPLLTEALDRFRTAGVRLKRDDGSAAEIDLDTLREIVNEFRAVRLPRWRALGLIPEAENAKEAEVTT